MGFKEELSELIRKYPEVESVSVKMMADFVITKSISNEGTMGMLAPSKNNAELPSHLVNGTSTLAKESLSAAEATINSLKSRAGITITE